MFESRLGEFAALMTAVCWSFGAMAFQVACRRAGAMVVNWIRLALGLLFLCVFCYFYRGLVFPLDASPHAWLWLTLSGIVGFTMGDLLLFRAFVVIGARLSMLVMALVPLFTTLIGWMILDETMGGLDFLGMTMTVGGVAWVVLKRNQEEPGKRMAHPIAGVLMAMGGALGQSIGLVLSKHGMGEYDPFAATQVRLFAGTVVMLPVLLIFGRWQSLKKALQSKNSMLPTSMGAFFGPFLGVSLSLLAIQYTTAGVAATIMAIVPVLIIPLAVFVFKEKVTWREGIGAVVAVSGVAVLFL